MVGHHRYRQTAKLLEERIYALISEHPEVLTLGSPWALFDVPGFYCKDLEPSLAQATVALRSAQRRWRQKQV